MTRRLRKQMTRPEVARMLMFWLALFVATAFVTGFSVRAALAAFIAWIGGIVTAEVNDWYNHRSRAGRHNVYAIDGGKREHRAA